MQIVAKCRTCRMSKAKLNEGQQQSSSKGVPVFTLENKATMGGVRDEDGWRRGGVTGEPMPAHHSSATPGSCQIQEVTARVFSADNRKLH